MRSSANLTRFVCTACRRREGSRVPLRTWQSFQTRCLNTTTNTNEIELSPEQINRVQALLRLRSQLQSTLGTERTYTGITLEQALGSVPGNKEPFIEQALGTELGDREVAQIISTLNLLKAHRSPKKRTVRNPATQTALEELGVIQKKSTASPKENTSKDAGNSSGGKSRPLSPTYTAMLPTQNGNHSGRSWTDTTSSKLNFNDHSDSQHDNSDSPERNLEREDIEKASVKWAGFSAPSAPRPDNVDDGIASLEPSRTCTISPRDLTIQAVASNKAQVPQLAHDLSRVLFNPGVYHLQDPHSGVFNFDPYLRHIMPVSEFNFDALNPYVTSSQDLLLRELGRREGKRYIGSTSSLTGILTHFHYLLSQFRPLSLNYLSRAFDHQPRTFTVFARCPTALFLRHVDGMYAVDADKEFDTSNILMEMGKSMEKLLTLPKDKYEEFRRSNKSEQDPADLQVDPEVYNYSHQGDVLMRSQLDAYDPRLPGSGLFDLKTRAVVSIRFNARNHEQGLGYQIRSRYGLWESFEREYYDMMRAALLRYSLQARIGRMDGIFVAYHNVERIFGFQYIPTAEMDIAIHGQEDRTLGDQEFKMSVNLMNEIFDRATKAFPGQSLRVHCETRPSMKTDIGARLEIFAQPFTESEIDSIQRSRAKAVAVLKEQLLSRAQTAEEDGPEIDLKSALTEQAVDEALENDGPDTSASSRPLYAATVKIVNHVNGLAVPRPRKLGEDDDWHVDYQIVEHGKERGHSMFTACRNRRKKLLADAEDADDSRRYYLKLIRRFVEEGSEWRKAQEKMEAEKGLKILYP